MLGRFPFVLQSKYPHMRPEDIGVWEEFIKKNPDYYDRVDYDFRVGEGRIYPSIKELWGKRDMRMLSQLRIDAVGYKGDRIDIIEIKPSVNVTALGQVITYTDLFIKEHPGMKNIVPTIVASREMPDVRRVAEERGIKIILV